ncbi:unnamed protein product [Closterium sp. NIES-53]
MRFHVTPRDFYPHRSTAATGAPAAGGAAAEPRPWLSAACAWAAPFALGAVLGAVACSLLLLPLALTPLDAQGGDEGLLLQSHADTWQEGQEAWQRGAAASFDQRVVPHPRASAASAALPLAPLAAVDSGTASVSGGAAGESDGDTDAAEAWVGDAAMPDLQGRHPAVRALVEANGQVMRQQQQAVALAEEDERGMHEVLSAALQELERELLMPHGTVSLVQLESLAALAEAVRARQGEANKAGAEGQVAAGAAGALQAAEQALVGAVAAGGGQTADLPSLVSEAQAAGRVGRMGHGAAGTSAGEGQWEVAADGEIWGGRAGLTWGMDVGNHGRRKGGMCVWQWWHDRHACMQHVLCTLHSVSCPSLLHFSPSHSPSFLSRPIPHAPCPLPSYPVMAARARVETEQRAGKAWAVLQQQQQWGEDEGAGSVAGEAVRAGTLVTVGDVEGNLTASPSDAPHVDSFQRLLLYLRPLASLFSLPLVALLSPNATHPLAPRLQSLIDATSARLQAASASLAAAQSALESSERQLWVRCGVKAGGMAWEERHDGELQRYRAVAGAAFDKWCVAWEEARPSHRLTVALAAPPHIWWRGGLWDGERGAAGVEAAAASERGGGVNAGSAAGEGERESPEISFLLLADPGAAQGASAVAVAPQQVVHRLHACASKLPRMHPAAAATSPPNPTFDAHASPSSPRMGPPLAELLLLLSPDSTHAGQQGDEQSGEGQQAGGVEAWQEAGRSIDPQHMLVLPLVAPHAHGAAVQVSGSEGGGGEATEGGARAVGMAPMAEWEGFDLLARAATGRLLLLLTWWDLPAVMHGEGEEGCKWLEQLTAGMAEDGHMGVVGVRTSRVERGVGKAEEGKGKQGERERGVGGGAVLAAMAQWAAVGMERERGGVSESGDAGKGTARGKEEAGRRLTGYVDGTPLLVRRHALMTLGGLGLAPGAPAAGPAAAVVGWALCTRMWLAGFKVSRITSHALQPFATSPSDPRLLSGHAFHISQLTLAALYAQLYKCLLSKTDALQAKMKG